MRSRCFSVGGILFLLLSGAWSGKTVGAQELPPSRGGQDRVGTRMPEHEFDRWVRTGGAPVEGQVTLYRWWTDRCPYCRSSLPAIERLRRTYEPKGLRVVAVYHPKPPRQISDAKILDAARRFGYGGEIAMDLDWSELRSFYLSTGGRRATSVSFLVDRRGVIRFVHPGPDLFPSEDPRHARQNADYELLERAIRTLVEGVGR